MLFKTLVEIQGYLAVSDSMEFDKLKPHIVQTENDFIIPLMGKALYDAIVAYYNGSNEELDPQEEAQVNTHYDEIIKAAQLAIIHLAYYKGFDVLNAFISDAGFKRSESENVKSLYKYQEDNLRNYFKDTGFNALDVMLEKMELMAKENDDEAEEGDTLMQDAAWYKAYHDDFINNAKEFSEIVEINNSRLIFLRLKKYMKMVKDLQIKSVVGAVNWAYILTEIVKTNPSDKVKAIITYVQYPLAFYASAMLMEDTGADLTDKGLVYDGKISQNGGDTPKVPSEIERVKVLVARNKKFGDSYLNLLRNYLIEHAEDWNGYNAPSNVIRRDNGGKKSVWV